ncbi:MAG: hypothetical protein GC185_08275 [Alphaproteobacteria bacterium]|nr:hypothetical protein [Alphaproteobacteria bacterium]
MQKRIIVVLCLFAVLLCAQVPALACEQGQINCHFFYRPMDELLLSLEAIPDLQRQAENGDPAAQVVLGLRYQSGKGVKQDYRQAREWYEKAASREYVPAYNYLGIIYMWGLGEKRDASLAANYFSKGMAAKDFYATVNLTQCYGLGIGVRRNRDYAVILGLDAVSYGTPESSEVQTAINMDADTDQQVDFKKISVDAAAGDIRAQINLGKLYQSGKGVGQDYEAAMTWYRKAADAGDTDADSLIGNLYAEGWGVKRDYGTAKRYWLESARSDQQSFEAGQARYNLWLIYQKGLGVAADTHQASAWLLKAASGGYSEAEFTLGKLYFGGVAGFDQDYSQSLNWLEKAGEHGHTEAQVDSGEMLMLGLGHLVDRAGAYYWFTLAAPKDEGAKKLRETLLHTLNKKAVKEQDERVEKWRAAH